MSAAGKKCWPPAGSSSRALPLLRWSRTASRVRQLFLVAAEQAPLLGQEDDEHAVGGESHVGFLEVLEQAARLEFELGQIQRMEMAVEHPPCVFARRDFDRLVGVILGLHGGHDGGRFLGLFLLLGLIFVPVAGGNVIRFAAARAAARLTAVAFLHFDAVPVGAINAKAGSRLSFGDFLVATATARFGLFGQRHAQEVVAAGSRVVGSEAFFKFVGELGIGRRLRGFRRRPLSRPSPVLDAGRAGLSSTLPRARAEPQTSEPTARFRFERWAVRRRRDRNRPRPPRPSRRRSRSRLRHRPNRGRQVHRSIVRSRSCLRRRCQRRSRFGDVAVNDLGRRNLHFAVAVGNVLLHEGAAIPAADEPLPHQFIATGTGDFLFGSLGATGGCADSAVVARRSSKT